jgi:pyruvate formate lyase activating enzyme
MESGHGPQGLVTDIKRFAVHDGPGIRTTVFLKGCPLRCQWCHNPETIDPRPQVLYLPHKCIACGRCAAACPEHHSVEGGRHVYTRAEGCPACFEAAAACPSGALAVAGRTMSVTEVMDEVRRDRPFYDESGGGLTLSGGEPTAQPDFALALLAAARAEGISTCLDTSGAGAWARLERFVPLVGVFLYDFKVADPESHRRLVGPDNRGILENLRRLAAAGARIHLRCPLVPGVNDDDGHLAAIARLAEDVPGIKEVHLLPYHAIGRGKWAAIGRDYPLASLPGADPAAAARWRAVVAAATDVPVRCD